MKELINFKDQNLNLDYLTLNLPNLFIRISEFADIFFRYGFNSKIVYVATNEFKTILEDKKLFYTLTFRLESGSWNKETVFIKFSGYNSRRLYFLITNGYFSISLLNCLNIKIGRIDIQFILLIRESDAYVFTSEAKHYQKLRRDAITKDVNKVMRSISKQLPGQLNISSHSFRIDYITQLWKDSKDIEFVKQFIGHQKLDTTSVYITKFSDQEKTKSNY